MIVVVDDDVGFAEELQDLLMLNGYRAVVVVTHPHASSLMLLGSAKLLILDLSLSLTTALGVLEELSTRGRMPNVLIVSGSGSDALEEARLAATQRGFPILGTLPKPVVPDQLLELIATHNSRLRLSHNLEAAAANGAGNLALSQIVGASSLKHHGMFLSLDNETDPFGIVPRALSMQRSLSMRGREGFVVVCLLDELLLTPEALGIICASTEYTEFPEGRIVFDLGPRAAEHAPAAADLRAAGFGLLVRVDDPGAFLSGALDLPVTMATIPAARLGAPDDPAAKRAIVDALRAMRARSVLSICTEVGSLADLQRARAVGFDCVTTTITAT